MRGRAAWFVGAGVLAVGALVYLVDRAAGSASLLPAGAWPGTARQFGAIGAWLPSFHPFAFSLVFAALAPTRTAQASRACAAWWAVNIAFEFGQLPYAAAAIAAALDTAFGQRWPARALANYFLRGTFDRADLLAATAGAGSRARSISSCSPRQVPTMNFDRPFEVRVPLRQRVLPGLLAALGVVAIVGSGGGGWSRVSAVQRALVQRTATAAGARGARRSGLRHRARRQRGQTSPR